MKSISIKVMTRLALAVITILTIVSSAKCAVGLGTITLKNGTVYEEVAFTIDNTYKVLEFKLDDQKKAVSFTDIEAIVDPDGNDITEKILGGYHKVEKKEVHLSETDEVYKHGKRKLWSVGFCLGGNYSIPAGDYYEGLNAGMGIDGDFLVALTHNFALRASISYSGINAEEGLAYILPIAPDEYLMLDNYKFSSMGYFLSFQYYHRPDRETPGKMIYNFYSGLGLVTHKTEADDVYVDGGVEIYRIPLSETETKFATTVGGGLTHMFDPVVGFYVAANMDMVWLGSDPDDNYFTDDIVYAYQFDLKAGITLLIK